MKAPRRRVAMLLKENRINLKKKKGIRLLEFIL